MKLNVKGRPFSWSYTQLKNYEGCPWRWAQEKFYCTVPFVENEAIVWGNRVHKAAELALQGINPKDPEAEKPVWPYIEAFMRSGLRREAELEIALTRNFTPINWFAKAAWFRIKLDVILTNFERTNAKYFDWKTGGKIRHDDDQLKLGCAALSVIRPEIEKFEGKLIWTKHKTVTGMEPLAKDQISEVWKDFLRRVRRMEDAWNNELFPARPSGLCPWCNVKDCASRRG